MKKNNDLFLELKKKNFIEDINALENKLTAVLKETSNYKDFFLILSKYHVVKIQSITPKLEELFIKLSGKS